MDNNKRKEIALEKITAYERITHNIKNIWIDNKSDITNIIFTGLNQKYYMMISWFNEDKLHNYLYLNCINSNNFYFDENIKNIILDCNSKFYNLIGISYGGSAALYYSSIIPTYSVITIDPIICPSTSEDNLKNIFKTNEDLYKSVYFLYYSKCIFDITLNEQIINILKTTRLLYFNRCSQEEFHSGNTPTENVILNSIDFVKKIKESGSLFIMKTQANIANTDVLPWT